MGKKTSQPKTSSERITKRLLDNVARGKHSALDTIGQIGSRAVKPLLKAMQSPFPQGVDGRDGLEFFTAALSRAAEYDAGPLIKELEKDELASDSYLWLAYAALGGSQDKRVTEVLLAGLSHKSALIRDQCLSGLCRRRTPNITEHILPRICDRSSSVCFTAVSALLCHPEYRDQRAIPYLERLLKRKRLQTHSPGTKQRAIAVLEKIRAARSNEPIEHLDWSHEQVDLKRLKEIIAGHPLKSLNLTDAKGVNDRVIQAVSEASDLEELSFYAFSSKELNLKPLGKLKQLKLLKLGNISIRGNNNARVFAELPLLECLTLGGCWQGDDELKPLKKLKNIKHLELDFHTTDAGFEQIQHLTQLEYLSSLGGQVTSAALKYLKRMKNLRFLRFHMCRVGEGRLEDLTALSRLEVLLVGGCGITDEGMRSIGKLQRLRYLQISANRIMDRGIQSLKSLQQLRGLDLRSTQVTDECIATLIKLPRLRQLLCQGTKITKAGKERFNAANPECSLKGTFLSLPPIEG